MNFLGFLIAILAGAVAAVYTLLGGSGWLMGFAAYSLCGAATFLLIAVASGYVLPAPASPAATDLP